MRKIGVHLSISGGLHHALTHAQKLKIQAVQIFLKNSNRWSSKPYTEKDIEAFKHARSAIPDIRIFAHSGYLINLAGTDETYDKSIESLCDELFRAELLGIEYLVLHPGSHGDREVESGIRRVAESLDLVFDRRPRTKILLETTAGQGSSIGHRFEQLRRILDLTTGNSRLGICMDTCHIFAAGYDIASPDGYREVISSFRDIIGLDRLGLIHLNDSKRECGSRVDRHEHIGKGRIGSVGFRSIMNDPVLEGIPMILETPKFNDDEADKMNLKKVRSMVHRS